MKLQISCDDGFTNTIYAAPLMTAAEVAAEFLKLRRCLSPLSVPAVAAKDCILALPRHSIGKGKSSAASKKRSADDAKLDAVNEFYFIGDSVAIGDVVDLAAHGNNGDAIQVHLFGLKMHRMQSSLHQIAHLQSKLTTISKVISDSYQCLSDMADAPHAADLAMKDRLLLQSSALSSNADCKLSLIKEGSSSDEDVVPLQKAVLDTVANELSSCWSRAQVAVQELLHQHGEDPTLLGVASELRINCLD